MSATVGEDGVHKVELTSESDEIKGDELTIYYERGDQIIQGGASIGVESGSVMIFTTDFEDATGIGPGIWEWEVIRDTGGTLRQVDIKEQSDNRGTVRVTDRAKIQ